MKRDRGSGGRAVTHGEGDDDHGGDGSSATLVGGAASGGGLGASASASPTCGGDDPHAVAAIDVVGKLAADKAGKEFLDECVAMEEELGKADDREGSDTGSAKFGVDGEDDEHCSGSDHLSDEQSSASGSEVCAAGHSASDDSKADSGEDGLDGLSSGAPTKPKAKKVKSGVKVITATFNIDGAPKEASLKFKVSDGSICAHCPYHDRCRLTRTVLASKDPKKKWQGRPLGCLTGWLLAGSQYESKRRHMTKGVKRLKLHEREDARIYLLLHAEPDGASDLFQLERDVLADEAEEPPKFR
jgi:hypothetical protein